MGYIVLAEEGLGYCNTAAAVRTLAAAVVRTLAAGLVRNSCRLAKSVSESLIMDPGNGIIAIMVVRDWQ